MAPFKVQGRNMLNRCNTMIFLLLILLKCAVYLLRHLLYILRDPKKEDSLLDEPFTDNDGSSVDSSHSLILDRATSAEKFLSMAHQSLSKAHQSGAQTQTVAKEIVWFSYSVSCSSYQKRRNATDPSNSNQHTQVPILVDSIKPCYSFFPFRVSKKELQHLKKINSIFRTVYFNGCVNCWRSTKAFLSQH